MGRAPRVFDAQPLSQSPTGIAPTCLPDLRELLSRLQQVGGSIVILLNFLLLGQVHDIITDACRWAQVLSGLA